MWGNVGGEEGPVGGIRIPGKEEKWMGMEEGLEGESQVKQEEAMKVIGVDGGLIDEGLLVRGAKAIVKKSGRKKR